MAIDLADLAVRVNYGDIPKATSALGDLATASGKAEQATNRVGVSSVAQTRNMGAWAAIQAEATARLGDHSLAVTRLERNLSSLAERALGLNSTFGLLGSTALKFGVGDVWTVAVVGGIAAITAAFDNLTSGARAAKQAMDDVLEAARESNYLSGPGGKPAAVQYGAQLKTYHELEARKSALETYGQSTTAVDTQLAGALVQLEATWRRLPMGQLSTVRTEGRSQEQLAAEARRAAAPALEASKEYWRKQHEEWQTARGIIEKLNEDTARYARENPASKVANETVMAGLGIKNSELATSMPQVGMFDGLSHLQEVLAKLTKDLASVGEDTATDIASRKARGQLGVERFKHNWTPSNILPGAEAGAEQAWGLALESFSPAGLAYQAATTGLNYIANGLVQTGLDMLGMGQSMTAMRLELRKQREEYEASVAAYTHNDLAAQLAQNLAAADALRQSAKATLLTVENVLRDGAKATGQSYAAALQAITEAEAKNAEMIKRQQVYAQEDLAVRNLRATGHTDEASLLAFREAQQREMQKAIDDNRDALYLNSLATTENNELLAYQNGLLSDALRNAPTGFWANRYYQEFSTPRGADPFGTGMPPLNQPGPAGTGAAGGSGLTPPGSRGAPITIIVQSVLDGKVVATSVAKQLDQHAGATAGAGSSRSDALNRYPV